MLVVDRSLEYLDFRGCVFFFIEFSVDDLCHVSLLRNLVWKEMIF